MGTACSRRCRFWTGTPTSSPPTTIGCARSAQPPMAASRRHLPHPLRAWPSTPPARFPGRAPHLGAEQRGELSISGVPAEYRHGSPPPPVPAPPRSRHAGTGCGAAAANAVTIPPRTLTCRPLPG
ncbi:hypothetical protein QJS66_17985 [Kocuria rhizophila]|nr:hypothetical protein QJS66_17985 [Kocuria rhizophila]